jgi:RNA polymerase sigma-32 factor
LDQESLLVEQEENLNRRVALRSALEVLNPRERRILEARHLADKRMTLEFLADEYAISSERVRQIEASAFEKLRRAVRIDVARIEALQVA